MPKAHLVTGRITPERRSFGHNGLRLYVKDSQKEVDICVLLGVVDNQLVANVTGHIGGQSNVYLKDLVTQAELIVLNAVAFLSGTIFDVDIINVVREREGVADGSIDVHYMDNVHDVIADRKSPISLQEIYQLCVSDDGLSLRRCLNDLRTALRELSDSPFYCYRAIETIKNDIGNRFEKTKDENQWEVTREKLSVSRADIEFIKKLADPLRHGRAIKFEGAEWRKIVLIAWDVTDAYMRFLRNVAKGEEG